MITFEMFLEQELTDEEKAKKAELVKKLMKDNDGGKIDLKAIHAKAKKMVTDGSDEDEDEDEKDDEK